MTLRFRLAMYTRALMPRKREKLTGSYKLRSCGVRAYRPIALLSRCIYTSEGQGTNINHNILAVGVVDDAGEHLPRMKECITLVESIQNAISYNPVNTNEQGVESRDGKKVPVISSSGPTRKVAPAALALRMLSMIRSVLPSKSRAHWLRELK